MDIDEDLAAGLGNCIYSEQYFVTWAGIFALQNDCLFNFVITRCCGLHVYMIGLLICSLDCGLSL